MAATQKIYAGSKLRELRTRLDLTQARFAAQLGISTSYLNQIENNHRPLPAQVILSLARVFGVDVAGLAEATSERLLADLREVLVDSVFGETPPPTGDLQLVAANAPAFGRAVLTLHKAYRQLEARLAHLNESLGIEGGGPALLPWEEVRDYFHYSDNYIDEIDRAAEAFAATLDRRGHEAGLPALIEAEYGIEVRFVPADKLRRFDPARRQLLIADTAPAATQRFQMLHHVAVWHHGELLDSVLEAANLSDEARRICRVGLANYFAGAALLPYTRFAEAARALKHDLDALAYRFAASPEQVAHRLSTLQRPGARGVPVFFVRVDQAGTITKRHSATQLQFARFGGACPLWNVHQAFERPGTTLRQLAETPDGARYFCLAREIVKPRVAHRAPTARHAIALGCEVAYAREFVYADDLDIGNDAAYEPIGISCRICSRRACPQRALPPLEGRLVIDRSERDYLPYSFDPPGPHHG